MSEWELTRPSRPGKRRRSSCNYRETKSQKAPSLKALIVDSGAHTIKVGYSKDDQPRVIPNCIMKAKSERKRLFVGQQVNECRDCSGLYFLLPCERGYITRWEVQKPVWDHVFSKNVCPIDENPVILTQPLYNFKSIQDCIDEIFFEEYEVSSLFRCCPADLAYLHYAKDNNMSKNEACLIVDSGYSFTHVVPYIKGNKFLRAVRRVNVGGKLLTNHLKDIISYRQYNVMEETYVINQVKEDTCYVCPDIRNELSEAAKPDNSVVKNYVLPDFNVIRRGYIQDSNKVEKDEEDSYQILRLNNERFAVPEILFHPSDIGMKSMGLAEAIKTSIFSSPKQYQKSLAKHIVLVGGNCKFPGFKERMYTELRSMLPDTWQVNLYQNEDPIGYAWKGGNALLKLHDFRSNLVTKQDYEELGSTIIQERFNNFLLDPGEGDCEDSSMPKETFRYLPKLKSPSIFGKQDVTMSNEPINNVASNEESNSKFDSNGNGEDPNVAEETSQETEYTKKTLGRPLKNRETEIVELEENHEEPEPDLTQSVDLFPFGTKLYL